KPLPLSVFNPYRDADSREQVKRLAPEHVEQASKAAWAAIRKHFGGPSEAELEKLRKAAAR
ncbi:MAG: hypothetical protein KGR26_10700, partial [Cyanobacteria bacterium REEB65]|nr:hypothetical protein [Cyanobacteria bacterium REEB65]